MNKSWFGAPSKYGNPFVNKPIVNINCRPGSVLDSGDTVIKTPCSLEAFLNLELVLLFPVALHRLPTACLGLILCCWVTKPQPNGRSCFGLRSRTWKTDPFHHLKNASQSTCLLPCPPHDCKQDSFVPYTSLSCAHTVCIFE